MPSVSSAVAAASRSAPAGRGSSAPGRPALDQHPPREDHGRDPDRDVHQEHEAPARGRHQEAAEGRADAGRGGGDRAPERDPVAALLARERLEHERERGRHDHRRAERLDHAEADEHAQRRGDRAQQRRDGEHDQRPKRRAACGRAGPRSARPRRGTPRTRCCRRSGPTRRAKSASGNDFRMSGNATFTIVASMNASTAPSEATVRTRPGLETRCVITTRGAPGPATVTDTKMPWTACCFMRRGDPNPCSA